MVLTREGGDVGTLGVKRWADLKGNIKTAFLNANKITIAQAHCKVRDLGKNAANEVNCKANKQQLKTASAKKQSGTTQPYCGTVDGKLY